MNTTVIKLDSKIFNQAAFRQAISSVPYKSAKVFQSATVDRMVESVPAGRIEKYKGKSSKGFGFSRGFKRSARGQRPAVETGTLIRSVNTDRTGDFSARVDIKHNLNPRNHEDAKDYAERLQEKLGRLIMTKSDAKEAEDEMANRIEEVIKKFV